MTSTLLFYLSFSCIDEAQSSAVLSLLKVILSLSQSWNGTALKGQHVLWQWNRAACDLSCLLVNTISKANGKGFKAHYNVFHHLRSRYAQ